MVFEFIVATVALGGLLSAVEEIRSMDKRAEYIRDEGTALRIENVRAGGVVHLRNIGPERKAFDINIDSWHLYREGIYEWTELEGTSPEGKVWISISEYDGLEVSVVLEKLRLSETSLDKEELQLLWDKEAGNVQFEGKKYVFDECGTGSFYEDGNTETAYKFDYWSFYTTNGKYLLSVEKWHADNSYDVFLSQTLVPSSQIKVYRNYNEEQEQSA